MGKPSRSVSTNIPLQPLQSLLLPYHAALTTPKTEHVHGIMTLACSGTDLARPLSPPLCVAPQRSNIWCRCGSLSKYERPVTEATHNCQIMIACRSEVNKGCEWHLLHVASICGSGRSCFTCFDVLKTHPGPSPHSRLPKCSGRN